MTRRLFRSTVCGCPAALSLFTYLSLSFSLTLLSPSLSLPPPLLFSIFRSLQSFLHKSRHDHACRRVRGPGGRFLTKAELNQYRKQLEAQDPEGSTAPAPLPGPGRSKQVRATQSIYFAQVANRDNITLFFSMLVDRSMQTGQCYWMDRLHRLMRLE